MMADADYMERALSLAMRGRGRTSPNPMVGAVVVAPGGVVVGDGYHDGAGRPHAETHALDAAGARARGATLYCTLEPCCHIGRTGPCVERIVAAGISRVVASIEDPNPLVSGKGTQYLRNHGVAVETGLSRAEASRLNSAFFTFMRARRPFVTMKIAMSLDARVADRPGARTPLTGPAANRRAHQLRAEVDAIGVGSGTLLADDPLLTARAVFRPRPLVRVIFDRRLRTPPSARVFSTIAAGPIVIFAAEAEGEGRRERAARLVEAGATLELLPTPDLQAAVTRLGELQVTSLLLEGGSTIHHAAWTAGVVDRVHAYVTPKVLGDGGLRWLDNSAFSFAALHDLRAEPCGPDVFLEGYVHRAD